MGRMVRKQICLDPALDELLSQRAEETGVSQGEIVRIALTGFLEETDDSARIAAWERMRRAVEKRMELGPVPGPARRWTREDAYDDAVLR